MKRTYVKPDLYVENFSLSQSIAAGGCGAAQNPSFGTPTSADSSSCGWEIAGDIIWANGPGCSVPYPTDSSIGGVCYHNPNGGASIFSLS